MISAKRWYCLYNCQEHFDNILGSYSHVFQDIDINEALEYAYLFIPISTCIYSDECYPLNRKSTYNSHPKSLPFPIFILVAQTIKKPSALCASCHICIGSIGYEFPPIPEGHQRERRKKEGGDTLFLSPVGHFSKMKPKSGSIRQ